MPFDSFRGRLRRALALAAVLAAAAGCSSTPPQSLPTAAAINARYYAPVERGLERFSCTVRIVSIAVNGHSLMEDGKFAVPPGVRLTPDQRARIDSVLGKVNVFVTVARDGTVRTDAAPLPPAHNLQMLDAMRQMQEGLAVTAKETLKFWAWLALSQPFGKSEPAPVIARSAAGYSAIQHYGAGKYVREDFDGRLALRRVTLHDAHSETRFETRFHASGRGYVLDSYSVTGGNAGRHGDNAFRVTFRTAATSGFLLPREAHYRGSFLGIDTAGSYALGRCVVNAPGTGTTAAPAAVTT